MTQLVAGHLNIQQDTIPELNPSYRLLLGPGPCNVDPRILRIASAPQLGHIDPEFFAILEETAQMLRWLFQTKNEMTLCVSGSGFSGAEAVLCNLLEEGDTIIVGSLGFFSGMIVDISQRAGAHVVNLETELGAPLEADVLEQAFRDHPGTKIFATGLGALPGLAPVTLNEQAVQVIKNRKKPVQSYYLDLQSLHRYWNGDHSYHHTACSNIVYGLREAVRIAMEEGLEARWARHQLNGDAVKAGIEAMGLKILTRPGYALSVLTAVSVPEGVDELAIRQGLLDEYNIEIGGGFGQLHGHLIRIGLMGYNSCRKNVDTILSALEHVLPRCGFTPPTGAALAAADAVYKQGS